MHEPALADSQLRVAATLRHDHAMQCTTLSLGTCCTPLQLQDPQPTVVSERLQFGALAALRECLAAAEPVVLARYAAAVFSALEGALEAEATDPRLLPPLLAALIQVPCSVAVWGARRLCKQTGRSSCRRWFGCNQIHRCASWQPVLWRL